MPPLDTLRVAMASRKTSITQRRKFIIKKKERKKEEDDCDVAIGMVLRHFRVGLSLHAMEPVWIVINVKCKRKHI